MAKRVQMTRKRGGWRAAHPDAVIVARPSKWGNPYACTGPNDRARVTQLFREYLAQPENAEKRAEIRAELRGKDLACWCPLTDEHGNPVPCHADVLLEIANDKPGRDG